MSTLSSSSFIIILTLNPFRRSALSGRVAYVATSKKMILEDDANSRLYIRECLLKQSSGLNRVLLFTSPLVILTSFFLYKYSQGSLWIFALLLPMGMMTTFKMMLRHEKIPVNIWQVSERTIIIKVHPKRKIRLNSKTKIEFIKIEELPGYYSLIIANYSIILNEKKHPMQQVREAIEN